MCLARVQFVDDDGNLAPDAIEDVAYIELAPKGVTVTDLVGSVVELAGEIQSIDFMESRVSLRALPGKPDRPGTP